jgi:uncharacterized protein with HEPN domain
VRDYRLYFKDILAAISSIEAFVSEVDFASFQADDKTSSAVVRKFEIIGEASKNIPEDMRAAHPEIPWREMGRMRDRLIHTYFGVDHHLVWQTIHDDLPELKTAIRKMLDESG